MNNQEAIERLQKCKRNLKLGKISGVVPEEGANDRIEAYELAIKALEFIDEAPTIEPKQGEWIDVNGDGSIMKCSKCGDEVCCKGNNFCPNCGARMRGEEE